MAAVSLTFTVMLLVGWSCAVPLLSHDESDTVAIVASNGLDPEAGDLRSYFEGVDAVVAASAAAPSAKTGELVSQWRESSGVNAEELGEYLQGDILTPQAHFRNGLVSASARWRDAVIPFEIEPDFNPRDLNMIEQAMNEYHRKTCIKFVRRSGEQDYIRITRGNTGCWSSVGRIGGMQEVNLQSPGCLTKVGTPIHELMHAAGFMHEQNRYGRDDYVNIYWQNIESGRNNNFDKAAYGTTSGQGVDYDYGSVMHYSDKSFSKNGQPTIVSKKGHTQMGQRDGFSRGDVAKLRAMYRCGTKRNDPIAFLQSIFG